MDEVYVDERCIGRLPGSPSRLAPQVHAVFHAWYDERPGVLVLETSVGTDEGYELPGELAASAVLTVERHGSRFGAIREAVLRAEGWFKAAVGALEWAGGERESVARKNGASAEATP